MQKPFLTDPAYIRSCEQGRLGEEFVHQELSKRLDGTGLTVKLAAEGHCKAPFDIEVLDGGRILAGIENKDLRSSTKAQGTQIRKCQKRRKLAYARQKGIRLVFTTVTRRYAEEISFREGLINGVPQVFDKDLDHMVNRILEVRRSA